MPMLMIAESTQSWSDPQSENRQRTQPRSRATKLAGHKRYYYRHREARLDAQRRTNYGIPLGTYQMMFIQQEGRCAICGRAETGRYKGRIKSLAVDHNPATGKMRALLCQGCNKGIGSFRHEPNRLRAAIVYLDSHSTSFIGPFTTLPRGVDLRPAANRPTDGPE